MTFVLPKKSRFLAIALPLVAALFGVFVSTSATAQGALLKKKSTPALDKDDTLNITRVQIFLDENFFGPGKIDGRLGQFTTKALAHYNYSIGVDPKDWGPVLKKAKKAIEIPYTNYLVKDDDFGFIGDEALSKRHVIVDTYQNLAAIWDDSKLVAMFPVTPGQEKFIYRGDFEIKVMVNTPTFRYDKSMLKTGKRSENYHSLPPGPNSPVGLFWAGINKSGIGLHGTASPHTIGRSQSAGCIRFANWDAVRLAFLIRPGARVEVR